MTDPAKELEAAALSLPRDERAKLAERLLASLDEGTEVDEAWKQEVRNRLDAYRNGESDTIPVGQVLDEARSSSDR